VVTVPATTPIAGVFALCQQTGHTRVPVRELAGHGRILGFVNLKTTLFLARPDEPRTARDFLESALYLDEAMRLEAALQRLRDTGQRLAIVLDRNRREIGILTLEDILRFIFGEVSL
jgi:CBS domain containing-hemolysin-like protein